MRGQAPYDTVDSQDDVISADGGDSRWTDGNCTFDRQSNLGGRDVRTQPSLEANNRSRFTGRAASAIAVGAAAIILSSLVFAPGAFPQSSSVGDTRDEGAGGEGYTFDNVEVAPVDNSHPLTNPSTHAAVSFTYHWVSTDYPGARECLVTVSDADGRIVGQDRWPRFSGMQSTGYFTEVTVPVDGEPASADIECLSGRVDDPTGDYELANVEVVSPEGSSAILDFDAQWRGSLPPATQLCKANVRDGDGRQLFTYDFTLSLADGGVRNGSMPMPIPDEVNSQPADVTLVCDELERPATD